MCSLQLAIGFTVRMLANPLRAWKCTPRHRCSHTLFWCTHSTHSRTQRVPELPWRKHQNTRNGSSLNRSAQIAVPSHNSEATTQFVSAMNQSARG